MIYLLHFDQPYKHAKHYMGYTDDLEARVEAHRNGQGARLMAVIREAGIGFTVARTWEGGRAEERRLKNKRTPSLLCPICRDETLKKRRERARARRRGAING